MDKIKLSSNQKDIIRLLKDKRYDILENDYDDLNVLVQENILECKRNEFGRYTIVYFTDFGKAYIRQNPKLKNPSIWDDKKYIINTTISIVAIIISGIALYFSIKNTIL